MEAAPGQDHCSTGGVPAGGQGPGAPGPVLVRRARPLAEDKADPETAQIAVDGETLTYRVTWSAE